MGFIHPDVSADKPGSAEQIKDLDDKLQTGVSAWNEQSVRFISLKSKLTEEGVGYTLELAR